jgi:hypothetical protein
LLVRTNEPIWPPWGQADAFRIIHEKPTRAS